MLDWKLLAASIVALLVISSLFVGGSGPAGVFSDLLDKFQNFLGGSLGGNSLTGLFTKEPETRKISGSNGELTIHLSLKTFKLIPDSPVTVYRNEVRAAGFSGTVSLDTEAGEVVLIDDPLAITLPLDKVTITGLRIKALHLEEVKFSINDISTDAGGLLLEEFSGMAILTPEGIDLRGTMRNLEVMIGDLVFRLE